MSRFRCMTENPNDPILVLLCHSYNADIQLIALSSPQSSLMRTRKNYLWIRVFCRFCRNVRKSGFLFKNVNKSRFGKKYRKNEEKVDVQSKSYKKLLYGKKVERCRKKCFLVKRCRKCRFLVKSIGKDDFWSKK